MPRLPMQTSGEAAKLREMMRLELAMITSSWDPAQQRTQAGRGHARYVETQTKLALRGQNRIGHDKLCFVLQGLEPETFGANRGRRL